MMKKLLLSAALLFAASQALAQTTGEVANHAVPIGKGPGVDGWGAAAPGGIGNVLNSTGASTDPAFTGVLNMTAKSQLLGSAGGTNATGAVTAADANVLFYNATSNNWAGMGTDTLGWLWFKTGTSGSPVPALYIDAAQNVRFTATGTFATAAQYLAGIATTLPIAPSTIYPTEGVLSFSASITFDFSTFINASVAMTGNITTQNVSNVTPGKAGMITFVQDATGGRTSVWNAAFKFPGGVAPVLSTTPNAIDVLSYSCRSATNCPAALIKDVR